VSLIPLIIDCDPGVDDAIALLLAFAAPDALELIGITTVAGNVGLDLTTRNARVIRQIAGRETVPVLAGAARPLVRPPIDADHFHGESGLGTLEVFEPADPAQDEDAAAFIVEQVMRRPAQTVTLAVTGPMTNVAQAMAMDARLSGRLARIVAMGGARSEGGNITPSAEYNIYADPDAAQAVLSSGCQMVMLGLDATHQVRASAERIAAIAALGTPAAKAAAELLGFAQHTERTLVGGDKPPLHDPCTIAWLLAPHLFESRPCHIEVETASPLTLGHTAVEFRLRFPERATCRWVTHVDADGVFSLLTERLGGA
jgi:purine nucleosidase